jgi:SAM-dependent methyltransferase
MNELTPYPAYPLCEGTFTEYAVADCSQHARYSPLLSPQIRWQMCRSCGHVFRDGYYTEDACKIIFSGVNENQKVGFQIEQQRSISARIVQKVLPNQSSGIWLDVGFGNGSLLFTAEEYGFSPLGLDLRQQSVDEIKKFGIDAYCADIKNIKIHAACSVISMADVLEHMPFPNVGLAAARELLAEGGVLFLSMPNMDSVVWRDLTQRRANPYWGEIEHYHNFGRKRLYLLLEQFGFTPVAYGISERYRACMEIIAIKN